MYPRQLEVSLLDYGVREKEIELVYYGVPLQNDWMELADRSEHHEQWEVRRKVSDVSTTHRVRATDGKVYRFAIKNRAPGQEGCDEIEQITTLDMFEAFKLTAESGLSKRRYFIKDRADNRLVWEVDVFLDGEDKPYDKVKLELEIPKGIVINPQELVLPFELSETLLTQPDDYSPEEKSLVDDLYKTYNLRKDVN